MIFQSFKNILTSKTLFAQLKINEIMKIEGSLIFYQAGIEIGLFKILRDPLTIEELASGLKISNLQLLSSILDLGCSLNEISTKSKKYVLKGAMSKALADNIPVAELVKETVHYHADIAQRLGYYIINNEKGSYLKKFGGVIAESSRILEPLIKGFIYHSLNSKAQLKILEIGCGAGEYLKYYIDINKKNSGIAIDIDVSAVEIAQKKIKAFDVDRRFTVKHINIFDFAETENLKFDVVTAFSNMHYFNEEEKGKLFNTVYKLLGTNGRFLLATGFKHSNISSSYYNLIFSATDGLYPLPGIDDITERLKNSGFVRIKVVDLFGRSFRGVIAYK